MSESGLKSVNTCQNSMLVAYQTKIRQQQQFLAFIKQMLPAHLTEHLLYCVVSAKKCLLYADKEEWAAQLRLYLPIILHSLQASSLPKLELIEVRMIPQSQEQQVHRKANLPSKKNIDLIRENLQAVKDDELKSALLRLSQTLDRLS